MTTISKQDLLNEDMEITEEITEAIYILSDGTLWGGQFDMGSRGAEHREVELFTDLDRYDGNAFWKEVAELGLVMLIPETEQVLIHPEQSITAEQQLKIDQAIFDNGYEAVPFK